MDPNLFHLDWERTFEALVGIIVLAFLVERACALVFESRWYIRLFEDPRVGEPPGEVLEAKDEPPRRRMPGRLYPVKEIVAFGLAAVVCLVWDFDAVSIMLLSPTTNLGGKLLTAAVIAGGSKAAVTLFHSLMNVRSNAEKERQALKDDVKAVKG